jgi:3-hydroxyisobutyrate dehydrogenase
MSAPIGVVGLGNMGLPMVARLVGAGHGVVALARNETKAAAASALGATVVGSLAELAAKTNVILLSVPSAAEVEDITNSLGALLPAGSLIVDTSTISPAAARRIGAALAARGIDFVDAPVSGGPGGVEQATLAVMAGGDAGALDRAAKVVAPFTGRFVRCGPWVRASGQSV